MSVLTPLLNMDENMGLGTPNFFSSAWDPENSDFSFTEGYQSNMGSYTNYAPQFQQGQAEINQLDYFSNPEDQLIDQSGFQPKYPVQTQNDDLDLILASESSQSPPFTKHSVTNAQMQGIATYDNPVVFGVTELEGLPASNWSPMAKPTSPARMKMELANDTGQRTSIRYGQITPVDSPPEDSRATAKSERKTSTVKSKQDDSGALSEASKLKKPRKSKKKSLTKDQEEAKRKKFLERNRVAADKCRQNRKKWIDDLQAKAHFFSADNAAKRASVEELEQEIVQLRSMLFIHSRSCNEEDILNWVGHEARRVELDAQAKLQADDATSTFSPGLDEPSSPLSRPSTRGFGSVSDAVSRRYSVVTADDAITSPMMSGGFSGRSSRPPSIVA
jgi:hypothetical protein